MSILTALTRKWNYSVESPGAGRLVYREGNREYTFPIYEEDGVLVLVGVPSEQRIHFFFNWYWHPRDFSAPAGARILPRIAEHLRAGGTPVKVLARDQGLAQEFQFHPELYEHRGLATELLEEAGYTWFSDYNSIDLVHEDYGLEIGGIRKESDVKPILAALRRGFPHWHHTHTALHGQGREPGWTVAISMFPPESCASGWVDEN